MFSSKLNLRKFFLILTDYIILYISLFLALKIRAIWADQGVYYYFLEHFLPFLAMFAIWIMIFYLFDLYDLKKIRSDSFLISTLIEALAVSAIVAILFFYLFPLIVTPKTVLLILSVVGFFLLLLWRLLWTKFISRSIRNNVAMIGSQQVSAKIINEILNPTESDYNFVGFISLGQEQSFLNQNHKNLGHYKNLKDIIDENEINELVTAFSYHDYPQVTEAITECLGLGVEVTELPLFYEEVTGKVPVECIDQVWFLSQLKANKRFFEFTQRFLDLFFSSVMLIVFLVLMPILFLLIKIDSKGPFFYSQQRIGKNNQIFKIHKLRTMVDNAEKDSGAVWAQKDDKRVTRLGKFLRKTRLDEMPQLFNIFKGDMSLVGPRPERPEFIDQLKKTVPFYNYRHLVKPGLTGWAQIKYQYANSSEQTTEKLQYDLYYIKNRSILLSLITLIRTIRIIITKAGI